MFDAQAIIAEATAEAPKAETNAPKQELQATSEEAQANEATEENNQETDDISKKPDSELTPEQLQKREANRQSHLNRKLAKQRLRNENAELKARLSQLEQSTKPIKVEDNSAPKMENYDSLDEWVLATAKHLKDTELKSQKETQESENINAQTKLRIQKIGKQATEFAKSNPEYVVLYNENSDFLQNMPAVINNAFLEADNAPLALYALMKEGRLDDLEDLSPSKIAMEIGKAEERGKAYIGATKKVTSASTPIETLKGTGRASRDIDSMSVEELMKRFNK